MRDAARQLHLGRLDVLEQLDVVCACARRPAAPSGLSPAGGGGGGGASARVGRPRCEELEGDGADRPEVRLGGGAPRRLVAGSAEVPPPEERRVLRRDA